MAEHKKIQEGLQLIKSAEKSLKTSLLKWRPDYEIAAEEYSKAATCFKNAKSFEQCKDCLLKAADCHRQNRALFHCAKSIENALLACKDMGDLREVAQLAERSCSLYQQHGSPDAAASALCKAARILEETQPEQAVDLYQRAADISMSEHGLVQAGEYISKTARLLVHLKQYDRATSALKMEICIHQQADQVQATGRIAVVLVLVQLARGDTVAAEKVFKEWGSCCELPEVQTLEMLLTAYDEEDPDAARTALNSPFIKSLDVEYSRLARDLPLPKGSEISLPKPTVRPHAAPSYVSPKAAGSTTAADVDTSSAKTTEGLGSADAAKVGSDDATKEGSDDEYEGGLC